VRVHRLTTGVVRPKRGSRGIRRYLRDDWSDETLPVNAFALEHRDGLLLFDTGQTAEATRPGYFPGWQPWLRLARFELRPEDEVAAQLARIGLAASDVRWVVLSHLHTDHAGGIAAFARAEVLVSRAEWESARGLAGRVRGYLPQYWPAGLAPTLVEFDGPAIGPFGGSHDVAGDGRLLLVPTPGHTRGHACLLARDSEHPWLIGGDLAHTPTELRASAPDVAEFCAREGIGVLLAHDPDANPIFTAAPASVSSGESGGRPSASEEVS
jgi:N-acyl homoserine lactone hydrolase